MALLEGFGLPRLPPTAAPERYREWLDQMRGAAPQFASYGSFESFAGFLAKRNARLGWIGRSSSPAPGAASTKDASSCAPIHATNC